MYQFIVHAVPSS